MRGIFIGAVMISHIVAALSSSDVWYCGDLPGLLCTQVISSFLCNARYFTAYSVNNFNPSKILGGATPGLELAERSIINLMANTDTNKDGLISRDEAELAKVTAGVFNLIARGDGYTSEDDLYVHFGCISNEVIVEPLSPSTPHTNKHG